MATKIYASGNYVIVETDTNIFEYAKGHTLYTLVDDVFYIKEITQGQFKVSVADLDDGNITSDDSGYIYNVGTFTTFLRDNTGFKTAPGGSGAEWGDITGTLSTQTDLQNALDAKQDDLVSGTNIKTINGNSVLGSGDLVVGGSSGRFGIADSNGAYTYYTTLTLAMTAVTSGQTIEMFADVTETGAVTITLKNGVTLNGNGHTYNVTNAGTSDVFETTVAGTYRIYNLNVIRTNATGGFILRARNFVVSLHYFDNSYFITNRGGISSESANVIQRFYNANITITGSGQGFERLQDAEVYNFNIRATSTCSTFCINGADVYNSIFTHEGTGTIAVNINAFNSTFIARGGGQTIQSGGNISNCSIYNYANYGSFINCNQFNNCIIYSASSFGTYTESTTYYRNCVITSAANIAVAGGIHYNNSITSRANIGAIISTNNRLENCVVQSLWNNVSGHAVRIVANSTFIKNTSLNVTNASANCINALSAYTSKYASNVFEGATTPVDANITQGMVNTEDTFGNITI